MMPWLECLTDSMTFRSLFFPSLGRLRDHQPLRCRQIRRMNLGKLGASGAITICCACYHRVTTQVFRAQVANGRSAAYELAWRSTESKIITSN